MAKIVQFVCDNPQCGAVRGNEDGWWKVVRQGEQLCVRPFNPEAAILTDEFLACGEGCMLRLISLGAAALTQALADGQADGQK